MNPNSQEPAWSPEEHLERVYRRGRQLRRRRQLGATSAAVAAVVGLAVMISGPTSTVLQPLRTVTGSGGGGGTSDNVQSTDESSSTTAPDGPEDRRSGPNDNETAAPTATTRRTTGATATTVRASSPTTAGSTAGTTPPPTSPIGDCRPGDLIWTTATNKSSYRAGDTVEISLHVRNTSDHPCYAPRPCGVPLSASVTDSAGGTVWQGAPTTTRCDFGTSAPMVAPRDGYSYGTAGSWTQAASNGARAPVGTYRATARRGTTTAGGATFALR